MLKNLSPKFIEELENPNRKPFALLEIMSRGTYAEAKTEADWGNNVDESNVDYTSSPPPADSVILAVDTGGSHDDDSKMFPTGDGTTNDAVLPASDVYAAIDEETADDDTTKMSSSANGTRVNLFTFDLVEPSAVRYIKEVKIVVRSRVQSGSTSWTEDAILRIGGANHTSGSSTVFSSTSYVTRTYTFSNYPVDASAWTIAKLDNIQEIGVQQSAGSGYSVLTTQLYFQVVLYDYQASGEITTEHDLSGANINNDILISIDQKTPNGTTLAHYLQNPAGGSATMTPTGAYDETGETTSESYAYNGNDANHSTTLGDSTVRFWVGRDSGNNDTWGAEPDFVSASLYVTYQRLNGTGNFAITVETSAGTLVGTILTSGNGNVSKRTSFLNVTSHIGDLADLRVKVESTDGISETTIYIYDVWIEGVSWGGDVLVVDGSRVPTGGYDRFRVRSLFAGGGQDTSVLYNIRLEIPDNVYLYHTESLCESISGSYPYLDGIPGRSTSVDLKEFVTTGIDLKANLIRDEFVIQMLRENHFKNLQANVRIGLYRSDITENDLINIYQGKVSGYSVGMDRITVNLKDGMSDLSAKWPQGSGTSKPSQTFTSPTHLVDVIDMVMDDVSVQPRFINSASLNTLKTDVGYTFVTYRGGSPPVATGDTTIHEPESAKKVIGELLQLLGAYMTPQEDGRIYFLQYDSSADPVDDPWNSSDFVGDPTYTPDVENLKNATYVFYDWNGEGDEAKNYANILIAPDPTSISNWGETAITVIKSKWLAGSSSDGFYGAEVAVIVGARETARRKNGMGLFPCKTTLSKFPIQVGDMVDIDMSDLIINPDVGDGDVVKFFVASKDPDWENDVISWKLVEAR